jgi:hypothetical protein
VPRMNKEIRFEVRIWLDRVLDIVVIVSELNEPWFTCLSASGAGSQPCSNKVIIIDGKSSRADKHVWKCK